MGKELLLEIGTEEIPATFLMKALEDMKTMAEEMFRENRLQHGIIRTVGTPRRLTLTVSDLGEKQDDVIVEKMGPAKKFAFDDLGNPTKAALGFAKGQGVEFSQVETIKTDKGEYLCVRKKSDGEATIGLLPTLLIRFISTIPFKKSMRWSSYGFRFARPIHWILALYGGEVIPFSIENLQSGRMSHGHRFMSNVSFPVVDYQDYLEKTKRHFVIVDPQERKKIILEEIQQAASSIGGNVLADPELLDTVTFLVEYPTAMCGSYAPEYLRLPREVLITSMMTHQKYFPVVASNNDLLPNFITVNNTVPRDPDVVRKGNEKVIRARLSDADFFFQEDQKIKLDQRVEDLKQVIYHTKLGSSFEKVERFRTLAADIADYLDPSIKPTVDRAAYLAKADLDTQMVGEFSELQGVMGREYALLSGESPEVAKAIYEHYLPVSSGGTLPETEEGSIVSIADKLDTIVGFFGVNLIPSGVADPYALRRQAIGIINIILNKNYRLPVNGLVDWSLAILEKKLIKPAEEVKLEVLDFFRGRFENQMAAQGFSYDVIDAVLATGDWDLCRCYHKIRAMESFKADPVFLSLATTFKRVENIIKNFSDGTIDPDLFESDAESLLYSTFIGIRGKTSAMIEGDDYLTCLKEFAVLKDSVDNFFESVLVMAKAEKIRFNRLSLLEAISSLFQEIADFSYISTEN
ncbi:MAG: glycine--tRNA ligase subunit beta [Syntrophales bacterium]|jgi:glycyl-tRNA synthetase beta chain|nr:glycine--tRNA ligase subunit beta [Syntrophales bacterium]